MLYSDKLDFSTTPENSDSCGVISPIYRLEKEQRNPLATEKKEITKATYSLESEEGESPIFPLESGQFEREIYRLNEQKKDFLEKNKNTGRSSNQLAPLDGKNNLSQADVKSKQKNEAPILHLHENDTNFANYSVQPIQKKVYINRNGQDRKSVV